MYLLVTVHENAVRKAIAMNCLIQRNIQKWDDIQEIVFGIERH